MDKNKINSIGLLPIGTILHGTYRIDSYLSSGGFGNTYAVTNVEFEERYAIKEFFMRGISERDDNSTTISVSNAENETAFASQLVKFKKEARRLRKLNNSHIVKVYDLFDENGTAYYVMDFIDGESLADRIKRTGTPMTEKAVMAVVPQILDALNAAHEAGILHLDLKPANIMIDKQGAVKLIDFGASKQQSTTGGATATSAISYTNGFAPREQMEQNLSKFGPWTDIYALGATLYTLLTNRKPPLPSDIDDDNTKNKHISLPFPSSVSTRIQKMVLWMMNTNRNNRPQSVEEIENYLNGNSKKSNSASSRKDKDDTLVLDSEDINYSSLSISELNKLAKKGDDAAQAELSTRYYLDKEAGETTSKSDQEETLLANQDDVDYSSLTIDKLLGMADDEDDEAQLELGIREIDSRDDGGSDRKAFEWFSKAADGGNIEAEKWLGLCYYNGIGVSKNLGKAYYWYHEAARDGDDDAQYEVAKIYEKGEGIAANSDHAYYWYKKAAEQGNEDAIKRLQDIDSNPIKDNGNEFKNKSVIRKVAYILGGLCGIIDDGITDKFSLYLRRTAFAICIMIFSFLGARKCASNLKSHFSPATEYRTNMLNTDSTASDSDSVSVPVQSNTNEVW